MPAAWTRRLALLALAAALAVPTAGCRSTVRAARLEPQAPGPDAAQRPGAAAFFRSPLISHPSISPDGVHLAGILEQGGVEIVFVRALRGREIRPLGKLERTDFSSSKAIRALGWGGNERVLVSLEMPSRVAVGVRARQTRLMVVDLKGGRPKYLGKNWPYQQYSQFQDRVIAWTLPDAPDHILLNWWEPGEPGVSARRVNVKSGAMKTLAFARIGVQSWYANHLGQVMAGSGAARWGTEIFTLARAGPDDGFEELVRFDPFREEGFSFAAFSETPTRIYVWKSGERDALHAYDLETRSLGEALFHHPEVDLDRVWSSQRDGRLIAVGYTTDRRHWHFFDEEMQRDQAAIDRALPGTWNEIVSTDREERVAVVRASSDTIPPRYLLYDRARREMYPLFDALPELRGRPLSPMQPVEFEARDGLRIHGYLTRPRSAPPGPLPTIVLPHGGPSSRDVWGWDPEVQFLASRGFAVLQLNFRGSTGYGTRHQRLGYRQWGLAMQDDISDAVRWLVAQGLADPQRIGIFGTSYGGYAALMGMVKTPELFRAGASLAGVTDLIECIDHAEHYAWSDFNTPVIGDEWKDRDALAATSPARHAGAVRAPVLIAHGTEDPIVHVNQAHHMIDALEAAGREVEFHLYEGEVHGFLDERNAIDFYTRLAAFFERHLLATRAPAPSAAPPGS
jgi:dipeptidyl aminopeptidase/acylaminoacyl peptidase